MAHTSGSVWHFRRKRRKRAGLKGHARRGCLVIPHTINAGVGLAKPDHGATTIIALALQLGTGAGRDVIKRAVDSAALARKGQGHVYYYSAAIFFLARLDVLGASAFASMKSSTRGRMLLRQLLPAKMP